MAWASAAGLPARFGMSARAGWKRSVSATAGHVAKCSTIAAAGPRAQPGSGMRGATFA